MVQYKHKRTGMKVFRVYINTPGQYYYYQSNDSKVAIPASIVELGNDWKLVQNVYKILSLKNIGGATWIRQSNGKYKADSWIDNVADEYNLDVIYPNKNNSLYSVKRVVDGVVFTIGDKILAHKGEFTIEKMDIVNDQLVFFLNNPNNNYILNTVLIQNVVKNFYKSAIPLYKTEDGVEIWNPEKYKQLWGVAVQSTGSDRLRQGYNIEIGEYSIPSSNRKWFHDRRKAEDYLLLNTPCLSIEDVAKVYVTANSKNEKLKQPKMLLKLVKAKLGIDGE